MSKRIGCVENMVKRAMENVEAHITRNGKHVYAATYAAGILELEHYDTTILEYDLNAKKIVSWGGWSNSDRDALNTVLEHCMYHPGNEYFYMKKDELHLGGVTE